MTLQNKFKKFKFLPHTADIKFQAFGKTLNKVFENSCLATTSAIYEGKVKKVKSKKIKVKGKDFNELMYNFLDEVIYLVDAEGFLVGDLKIKIDEKNGVLDCELFGDDVKNYDSKKMDHIKSVTYSEMFVKKNSKTGKWVSQVVLDV